MYEVNLLPKAEKWLLNLSNPQQREVILLIKRLEILGYELELPYSRPLKGTKEKVKELRCTKYGNRLYYVHHENKVYVGLLGGDKQSQTRDVAQADKMAKKLKRGVIDYEKY
jgi:putative addiction module killer protein